MKKNEIELGNFYHVYNRGNSKQNIFLDEEDYLRFQKVLYLANSPKKFHIKEIFKNSKKNIYDYDKNENIVEICAWVQMKNHYHLLIYISRGQASGNNNLMIFMQKVGTAYSMYFNTKYNRTGSLFEGRYKIKPIKDDNYLKHIFAYIHLNPVKYFQFDWKEKGIKNIPESLAFLNKYKHSSYHDILLNQKRSENKIIVQKNFLYRFEDLLKQKQNIVEWLSFTPEARPRVK